MRPFWDRLVSLPREERDLLALSLVGAIDGIGADWLPRLEAALQACPQEPALAYAMGRALLALELWGKARQFLEQAAQGSGLPVGSRRDAWLRLARLAERDRDEPRAADCYRLAATAA
jgi:HemY protein